MPRLVKFAIAGFLAYAILTAAPEKQAAMFAGGIAIKDAAIDACIRDDGLCTRAFNSAAALMSRSMTDTPDPWLDDPAKRTVQVAPRAEAR